MNTGLRKLATSIGVFSNGTFHLDANNNLVLDAGGITVATGINDVPLAGDFNGDGKTDLGLRVGKIFYLDGNGNRKWDGPAGGDFQFSFGIASDKPIIGDWNGDGISDVGVHRDDVLYLDSNGSHASEEKTDVVIRYVSQAGDQIVVGDWNGDGKSDVGMKRGKVFYLDADGSRGWTGGGDLVFTLGLVDDKPITGIWM